MKKKVNPKDKPVVTNVEMAVVFAQFSMLINAGRPVLEVLKTIAIESKNPKLNEALVQVHDGCRSGHNLTEQMRKFPDIFSPSMVTMINLGEVGGTLDTHLERLGHFLQTVVALEKGA